MSSLTLEQEVEELKSKVERKELQFNRLKGSTSREIEALREEFEEYRKRSHQHESYMKQLFEENTHTKEKIINDTKKHMLVL